MSIPVRTLSPQEAEILARTVVTGLVSNGCVERYGLRWRSDALRTWEVEQRGLGRKPEVTIRIDELDLSVVYVELLDNSRKTLRATSTQPKYTRYLSLFEHRRLKAAMRKQAIRDRLVLMQDEEAFALRIQFYAALGRADDPVAYRRLVEVRDRLAALRGPDPACSEVADPTEPVAPAKKSRSRPQRTDDAAVHPATSPEPLTSGGDGTLSTAAPVSTATGAGQPASLPRVILKRSPL